MNITYKDSEGKGLKYFTQWDNNRVIELDGITGNNVMIHFYNRLSSRALVVQPKRELEKYVVNVPNILLQEPCDIMVAVFVENGEEGKTEEIFSIPVEAKTKPQDYEYKEDKDYINWVELDTLAKEKYKEMQNVVDDINNKLESGAFKGDKGDKGDTPIRGVDYWTEQDKSEVVNETKELVIPLIETDCGNKVTLKLDPKTYVMTLELLTKKNKLLSTATVDLPLETMVINARYEETTKELIIELKNGEEVKIPIGSIVNGLVDETTFNNKVTDLQNQITANNDELNNLVGEVSDVKQDIGNLKQEQVLQNKAIQKNVDDIIDTNKNVTRNTKRIKTLETNIFDSGVAEGENLNINDTALAEFQQVEMNINKAQNTTKGYNLIKYPVGTYNIGNVNLEFKISSFKLKGIASESYKIFRTDYKPILKVGEYNFSVATKKKPKDLHLVVTINFLDINRKKVGKSHSIYLFGKTEFDITINFTLEDIQKIETAQYIIEGLENGKEYDLECFTVLSEGSIKKPYEPYTGGIASPNPDYPQTIHKVVDNFEFKSCGKNLEPLTKVINGYAGIANPEKTYINSERGKTIIINANKYAGKTLTISTDGNRGNLAYIDTDTPVGGEEIWTIENVGSRVPHTFTVDKNPPHKFICIQLAFESEVTWFQLEIGEQTTPYEEYTGITNTVNLKGNEFLPRR